MEFYDFKYTFLGTFCFFAFLTFTACIALGLVCEERGADHPSAKRAFKIALTLGCVTFLFGSLTDAASSMQSRAEREDTCCVEKVEQP